MRNPTVAFLGTPRFVTWLSMAARGLVALVGSVGLGEPVSAGRFGEGWGSCSLFGVEAPSA